jgi:hypothetical protein
MRDDVLEKESVVGQRCRAAGDVVGKERASFPIIFWKCSNELVQDQKTLTPVSRHGSR